MKKLFKHWEAKLILTVFILLIIIAMAGLLELIEKITA